MPSLREALRVLDPAAKVFVSPCLLGMPCRYDGHAKGVPALAALLAGRPVVGLCPEVAGGLATPRPPAERSGDRVRTAAGQDVTAAYRAGAKAALALAQAEGVALAVLKARSPSCGHGAIYDGQFTGTLVPGDGLTAEALLAAGIPVYSEEDL